ncbi:hypothetical protein BKA93DRAFT_723964 [Sparassis latifolia]
MLAHCTAASNNGTVVNLRVEGANSTIYEGPIVTVGHNVTTASGGTHHCDGTNNNANPFPGPTCTSALDNASQFAGFTWDGTYNVKYDDYSITRIASSAQTTTEFWGILLNYALIPVGGCQQEVAFNDNVLFAYNAFGVTHFLELAVHGSADVLSAGPVALLVTDGRTGVTIPGAAVTQTNGGMKAVSDADGQVVFNITIPGIYAFKASRNDSVRSNSAEVFVLT